MGEASDRMSGKAPRNGAPVDVPGTARDIDVLRDEIGGLVAELDRRRHEAFDVGLQLRRHPLVAAAAVSTVALVVGGLVAAAIRARRRRQSRVEQARRLRRAFGRMVRHPEEFDREPGILERVAMAAVGVAATTLAKQLVQRAVPARS